MSSLAVAVLDYGSGNLHSLVKALRLGGASVRVTADAADAAGADALVLPGVGAFGDAAARLRPALATLRAALAGGLPCLGICLGMQLLFAGSEEGAGEGLAVLPGRVGRLAAARLPHMGWNDVEPVAAASGPAATPAAREPVALLDAPGVAYFAHSFAAAVDDAAVVGAWSCYEGARFPSVVRRGAVWGTQFHPEKSGAAGLGLLAAFVEAAQ